MNQDQLVLPDLPDLVENQVLEENLVFLLLVEREEYPALLVQLVQLVLPVHVDLMDKLDHLAPVDNPDLLDPKDPEEKMD